MSELTADQFAPFMREVTGHLPFPWQQRLLDEVLDQGWPDLLDLPTGTGKTATLLIGIFALALAPDRMHRRIALVVDRRIIVDQVDAFARRLEAALADHERPTCTRVAARLRGLVSTSDAKPVRVVHLRGGIPRDDRWLGCPDQPTIIASTVDQVGSRLLFRGYGVSEGMRPVHAGILARDTLYLLDEVHLAAAFEQTLDWIARVYAQERWVERPVGRPLGVVRMSATPQVVDRPIRVFGLGEDDRAHTALTPRLTVSRMATLELVKTKRATSAEERASNHARLAEAACARALQALQGGAKAVGIVVNRVDTARRAAEWLEARDVARVLLITGRMRPFDRLDIQEALEQSAAADRQRRADANPTVVVATSCIEAGADLDFDALVTEVASLDALRQRFGRLDRLGTHGRAPAWILGCSDQLSSNAKEDPIYGNALRRTWEYLHEIAVEGRVDFGLQAFLAPTPERLKELLPAVRDAPVLLPSYLDLWSETRPAPSPDPDPGLWLHGKDADPERDVNVVFRADVPDSSPRDPAVLAHVRDAVDFLPPVADEAVSVRIDELRDWIRSKSGDDAPHVWRWGSDGLEAIPLKQIHPGNTIVVPARAGGLARGTWDPTSDKPVRDVAELARWRAQESASLRRPAVAKLRVDPNILRVASGLPTPPTSDDPDELEAAHAEVSSWLDELARRPEAEQEPWGTLLRALADPERRRVIDVATSYSTAAQPIRVWRVTALVPGRAVEATTEDAVSSFGGLPVTLAMHLADVQAWTDAFSRAAGLPANVANDVALAALLHDIGKADPRFQAMLRGGDPIAGSEGEPLAKSPLLGSLASRQRAEQRSGWPRGFRHELVSLALLDASPTLRDRANDLDLVRHLVASHHGWCRPWAPNIIDVNPTRVEVDVTGVRAEVSTGAIDDAFSLECASRFRRLCRRYGWHGLAYLEALLRLGDHRASALPSSRPGDQE